MSFRATHRMLIRATTEHNYETVDIDIENGTFKRSSVKMTETKIRVNKSILGEILPLGGKSRPLGLDEVEGIAAAFNAVRAIKGFDPLAFRTKGDEDKKENIKEIKEMDAAFAHQVRDVIPLD